MVRKCLVCEGYGQGAPWVRDLLGESPSRFYRMQKNEKMKNNVKIKKEEKSKKNDNKTTKEAHCIVSWVSGSVGGIPI